MKFPRRIPFIIFPLIVFAVNGLSQEPGNKFPVRDTVRPANLSDSVIFEKVEIEATFRGGLNSWRKFLERNLDPEVPIRKKAPAGVYTVWIQFIVDKDGNISEIIPLTNHGYGMEQEVIRILKLSPKWIPAIQFGKTVKAYRKQPVTFVIEEARKGRS